MTASTPVQGDPQAALDFMRWARPAGPWVLTAIPPEGGITQTRTFRLDEPLDLMSWVAERIGKLNLYWAVNPSIGPLSSEAKKEDVASVEFLHVDMDPANPTVTDPNAIQAHNEAERERILSRLEFCDPRPSAIIDSGGGFQAFWRLAEPILVIGNLALVTAAEAYNIQLATLLGADHCHNADRVMRLPGTLNIPDAKKRKKGRVERLASVVLTNDLAYPLSKFTAAPRVQGRAGSSGGAAVRIPAKLAFLKDLDELGEKVSNRTRMLIVQGAVAAAHVQCASARNSRRVGRRIRWGWRLKTL